MNELAHYGILGMKWGVRRSEAQLARARGKKSSEEENDDYKKAHSSKSVKSMSDKELRERLNRLNMEQQYKKLTTPEKSAGRKAVEQIVGGSAKQLAINYTTKYMAKGIEAAIKAATKK